MLRGFPQVEDLTQNEGEDNDVLDDSFQKLQADEVSEVESPSLAIQRIWKVGVPM